MGAAWLKNYLAPIKFLVNSIAQIRDDRVNFRNGFTSSQVLDADGKPVLTIDNNVANTSYEPVAGTIPIRNGSGTLKGNTITASSFTYSSAKTVTRDDPIIPDVKNIDAVNGWSLDDQPETNAVNTSQSGEWRNEIKPPVGSVLQSISVRFTPASTHTVLPNPPGVLLGIQDEDGVVSAYETPALDNPADLAAYEAGPRTVTKIFSAPVAIESNKRYLVVFANEDGVDAKPGLKLHRPARWTALVTNL